MKPIYKILLALVLLAGGSYLTYKAFFAGGAASRDVYAFVPEDFIYLIESDRPIDDWQDMSNSAVWKHLKTHPYFADIAESANTLDNLLTENKTITSLVKVGGLLISAHMTSAKTYDFVLICDLKGAADVGSSIMPILNPIIASQGYKLSEEKYFNYDLYSMYDPETAETFSFAFVGKVFVGSYSKELVKKSVAQTESENVLNKADLNLVMGKIGRDKQYSIFLNYAVFDRFLLTYLDEVPASMKDFNQILSYSAFDFKMQDDYMQLSGATRNIDSIPSYLGIFSEVGSGKVHADALLPDNTAMFSSIGFPRFADFYPKLMAQYEKENPEEYKDIQKKQRMIERFLGFDFEEDMFSWVTDEMATGVVPQPILVDSAGVAGEPTYAYFAMLHFDDYDLAKEKMELLAKRVKRRTLFFKFEKDEYKGFTTRYLDSKDLFGFFFKRLFDKIEQPHFTIFPDHVVFANDTASMHRLIDSYVAEKTLAKNEDYSKFKGNFTGDNHVFNYVQSATFFDFMRKDLDRDTRTTLDESKNYFLSFPHIGVQLYPGSGVYKTNVYGAFRKYETPAVPLP